MKALGRSRLSLTVASAILLSLLLAGQALAATWSPALYLTSSGNAWATGLVTLGGSTAVAVYEDNYRVLVRRSTDAGSNWTSPIRLSRGGYDSAAAGRGTHVDVVWVQDERVRYARSTTGGASFRSSVALSPAEGWGEQPSVSHGPNGLVAVAWREFDEIRVRVSTDNGTTFGAAMTVATTSASYAAPAVGVGKGIVYVAYFSDDTTLRVKRSLSSGASWSAGVALARNAASSAGASIAATGSQAYVAFTAETVANAWARYRRTFNYGATWASPANLSPATGNESYLPKLSVGGGIVRAVFARCLEANCAGSDLFYRQTSNGTTWTPSQNISTDAAMGKEPAGVGFAGKVLVMYTGWDEDEGVVDVIVRAGTP